MSEWISIKDRMPELGEHGYTLCYTPQHNRQFVAWFELNKGQWQTKRPVTHWMPLPEPPVDDAEGK